MKRTGPFTQDTRANCEPANENRGLVVILSDDAGRILSAAAVLQKQGTRFRFIEPPRDLKQILCAGCDNIEVVLVEDPLSRRHIRDLMQRPAPAALCPTLSSVVVLMENADSVTREHVGRCGAVLIEDAPQTSAALQNVLRMHAHRAWTAPATPEGDRPEFGALLSGVFEIRTLEEAEKLSALLARNTPQPEKLRIGIWELLSNAIEHGNLEIRFEEKTQLLETGRFQQEVDRRLKLERYRDRVARVVFSTGPERLHMQVHDSGAGFDFRKFLDGELQLERPNGRGIRLVCRTCFDELSYIGTGNTVEATVNFCPPDDRTCDAPPDEEAEED